MIARPIVAFCLWASISAAALGGSFGATADAAQLRNFRVGNWSAAALSDDRTGEFSHCAAKATYRSGISVYFAINRTFHWTMGLSSPNWQLPEKQVYAIAFTVDNMQPLTTTAATADPHSVLVRLQDNLELFNAFRRGQQLRIATPKEIFTFNLTSTSQLLQELVSCAALQGRPPAPRNPFASVKNASSSPKDDPMLRAEASTILANVLSQSGLQGYSLLPPEQAMSMKNHAAWSSKSGMIGTVRIEPGDAATLLKTLPARVIADDAQECKGAFLSGALPDDNATARVFTNCQRKTDKEPVTVYYLGIARKKGGIYVFSTMSIGSETPAKNTTESFRNAAFKLND